MIKNIQHIKNFFIFLDQNENRKIGDIRFNTRMKFFPDSFTEEEIKNLSFDIRTNHFPDSLLDDIRIKNIILYSKYIKDDLSKVLGTKMIEYFTIDEIDSHIGILTTRYFNRIKGDNVFKYVKRFGTPPFRRGVWVGFYNIYDTRWFNFSVPYLINSKGEPSTEGVELEDCINLPSWDLDLYSSRSKTFTAYFNSIQNKFQFWSVGPINNNLNSYVASYLDKNLSNEQNIQLLNNGDLPSIYIDDRGKPTYPGKEYENYENTETYKNTKKFLYLQQLEDSGII